MASRGTMSGSKAHRATLLRPRQRLGKYRIEKRLAEGGFAVVYRAYDTIEGVRVALKVPHPHLLNPQVLESFRREVRLAARLDHQAILPLKNAEVVDGHFVIVSALGTETLAQRLSRRLALATALDYGHQLLQAVACAHRHRIIHCDIKPENIILFPGNRLRLTDFGIAKVARRTVQASGTGTVGYLAPDQALGRPSFRSDVFSLGLVLYRMLSGHLPQWPFEWPPPGYQRLRRRVHPELIALLRRALELKPQRRFRDAVQMLAAYERVLPRARSWWRRRRRRKNHQEDWQQVRFRQFQRSFGAALEARHRCSRCLGPVSEPMLFCPWCGRPREVHQHGTRFPAQCRRCGRGMKLDWTYCPWCYGPGYQPAATRHYTDVRYQARCPNPRCPRRELMPWMRYCPWCHRKVRRRWQLPGNTARCPHCRWGVLRQFWSYCPWCGKPLQVP